MKDSTKIYILIFIIIFTLLTSIYLFIKHQGIVDRLNECYRQHHTEEYCQNNVR